MQNIMSIEELVKQLDGLNAGISINNFLFEMERLRPDGKRNHDLRNIIMTIKGTIEKGKFEGYDFSKITFSEYKSYNSEDYERIIQSMHKAMSYFDIKI